MRLNDNNMSLEMMAQNKIVSDEAGAVFFEGNISGRVIRNRDNEIMIEVFKVKDLYSLDPAYVIARSKEMESRSDRAGNP
ncbi:hypothetical protein NYR55_09370 [Sphingomonas sp. BGYR3]|uniref:hypothetical protein n=1 Tax=Sphingomonas sp. BGYR3 TaxID=2975483 RepID=UPI0021A6FE94|nr:hypothetical protein [Sphingomonas sp. BGYR3]MDG5488823.1 hypothetical protein [Sphingomonas sp. BGYR3]